MGHHILTTGGSLSRFNFLFESLYLNQTPLPSLFRIIGVNSVSPARGPVSGIQSIPKGFQNIRARFTVKSDATPEQLEELASYSAPVSPA